MENEISGLKALILICLPLFICKSKTRRIRVSIMTYGKSWRGGVETYCSDKLQKRTYKSGACSQRLTLLINIPWDCLWSIFESKFTVWVVLVEQKKERKDRERFLFSKKINHFQQSSAFLFVWMFTCNAEATDWCGRCRSQALELYFNVPFCLTE